MKKQVKIMRTIFMIVMILAMFASVVFGSSTQPKNVLDKVNQPVDVTTDSVENFGRAIVSVVKVIGVIVAVIVLLVLGVKYMIGSAEERAEYKKTMVPYIVGAVLIFASTTLVGIVYDLATSLNPTAVG